MTDPRRAQVQRDDAQNRLRAMVNREVTSILSGRSASRGTITDVEEAFVRAVYAPDKRLGALPVARESV